MADITFSPEEKERIIERIQDYFQEEHDREMGRFDAEFLLAFFTREIGPYFYNRGLFDAQAMLEKRLEAVTEAFYELEQPTESRR